MKNTFTEKAGAYNRGGPKRKLAILKKEGAVVSKIKLIRLK